MAENIIHMRSRKELSVVIEENEAAIAAEIEADDARVDLDRNNCIDMIDSARSLVDQGRLSGLIVIGVDPMTDLFYNEIRLDGPTINREMMFSYIGILETLKSELMELARMAPTIGRTGEIIDPYEDDEEIE